MQLSKFDGHLYLFDVLRLSENSGC